jgi:hypothetical protein
MVRKTKRLMSQLAANGRWIDRIFQDCRGGLDSYSTAITEADIDWPSETVEYDFSLLSRFTNNVTEFGYSIEGDSDQDSYVYPDEKECGEFPSGKFDILWVSKTEFIPLHYIDDYHGVSVNRLYAMGVQLDEKLVCFNAFRNGAMKSAPAAAPLGFLRHLLTPILHVIPRIVIKCFMNPPIEEVLLLIPTTAVCITKNIEISMESPSADLLRALASHPFHRRVLLHLETEQKIEHDRYPVSNKDGSATAEEMNRLLREFQHCAHLQVPHELLYSEAQDDSFAINPCFESLTIAASGSTQLSLKLLEGIVQNKRLTRLTVECHFDSSSEEPDWNNDLFRGVVFVRSSNLQCLTLASRYDAFDFDSDSVSLESEQDAFDGLTEVLESQSNSKHGLSRFLFSFPHSRLKPAIKSNSLWDARFSPSLLVNCLHRQPGGIPSRSVAGFSIERINQGVLYRCATNLIPCDLSASSATAIFDVLRCVLSENSRPHSE